MAPRIEIVIFLFPEAPDVKYIVIDAGDNSETQRLVQNVILKLEKINIVFVKPVMVKHP